MEVGTQALPSSSELTTVPDARFPLEVRRMADVALAFELDPRRGSEEAAEDWQRSSAHGPGGHGLQASQRPLMALWRRRLHNLAAEADHFAMRSESKSTNFALHLRRH